MNNNENPFALLDRVTFHAGAEGRVSGTIRRVWKNASRPTVSILTDDGRLFSRFAEMVEPE